MAPQHGEHRDEGALEGSLGALTSLFITVCPLTLSQAPTPHFSDARLPGMLNPVTRVATCQGLLQGRRRPMGETPEEEIRLGPLASVLFLTLPPSQRAVPQTSKLCRLP